MRHSNLRPLALVVTCIASLAAAGCVKTTATPIQSNAGGQSGGVQVFYSPPTDRPYTEIGIVTTQTGQTIVHDRSTQGMLNKLQIEAAKMGADAIIVRNVKEGSWGPQGGGSTGFNRGHAEAVAIKFQ